MGSIQSGGNWDFDFGESVSPHLSTSYLGTSWLLGRPNCHFQLRPCGINLIRLDGCLASDDHGEEWRMVRENPPATDTCVFFFCGVAIIRETQVVRMNFIWSMPLEWIMTPWHLPPIHQLWGTRKTVKIATYSLKLWVQSRAKLKFKIVQSVTGKIGPPRLLSHFNVGQMFTHFFFPPYHLPAQSSSQASWPIGTIVQGEIWPNWWLQAGVPENVCR